VASREPQASSKGGGKLLYFKYMFDDGTIGPLLVQAPKMYLPGGVREDIKGDDEDAPVGPAIAHAEKSERTDVSTLGSMGRECANNPAMVSFRELCDKIQLAAAKLVLSKGLHVPYCKTTDDVLANMSRLVFESQKWSEEESRMIVYPPSIKLRLNTNFNNKTVLTTPITLPDGTESFAYITHRDIRKGMEITCIVSFNWVYRRIKKNQTNPTADAWSYNISCSILQAVIENGRSGGGGDMATRLIISMPPKPTQ
jgi:hypothetical protein